MKSRELHTTPVLVVSNYSITSYSEGKYLHEFTPKSTTTKYQFLANQEPVLEQGQLYNIGYEVIDDVNWVDISAVAKADEVNPIVSNLVARKLGDEIRKIETGKSDQRVVHSASDGHYLGKKYAWRIYGMSVAKGTFYDYMKQINHPYIDCRTDGTRSIAYKDEGIDKAMEALIQSCVEVGKTGNQFKSNLLPNRSHFAVNGVSAITDKK